MVGEKEILVSRRLIRDEAGKEDGQWAKLVRES